MVSYLSLFSANPLWQNQECKDLGMILECLGQ